MEDLSYVELDPRPGYYYASIRDPEKPNRIGFLAGPFKTHQEAKDILPAARKTALDVSIWSVFHGFGTCRLPEDFENPPAGKLNQHLGVVILNGYGSIPKLTPEIVAEAQGAVHYHSGLNPDQYTGRVGKIYRIDGFLYVVLEDNGNRGLFRPLGDLSKNQLIVGISTMAFENMEEVGG